MTQLKQTTELRLKVDRQLKSNLQSLAKELGTSVGSLGLLYVNQILDRQPDLISTLERITQVVIREQRLLPAYHQLLASYSVLKFQSTEDLSSSIQKCTDFKKQADIFMEEFLKEESKIFDR